MNQDSSVINSKFKELGYSKFAETAVLGNVKSLILDFESDTALKLPEDYKFFLENYGESNFNEDAVFYAINTTPNSPNKGGLELSFFYGIGTDYDIKEMLKTYSLSIPKHNVPIAELAGGNQLCIDLNPSSMHYQKVYLWDHETCEIFLIANNFSDFIASFQKENSDDTSESIDKFNFNF